MTYQKRYIYAITTVSYDEANIIKEMIATGEYGFGQHDITTEAIIDFIGRKEFGSQVMYENNNNISPDADLVECRVSDDDGDFFVRTFDGVSEHIRNSMNGTDPGALKKLLGE